MKAKRWMEQVDPTIKGAVRTQLLTNLLSQHKVVRHTSAQVIGAVAALDVPNQQWPELLGQQGFVHIITNPQISEDSKESTLEACGYMLEGLQEGALTPEQTNDVLTSIIDGIRSTRPEPTRRAAVNALSNALDFCTKNFTVKAERDMIMTSVCEATQSTDEDTRVAALECIVRIAECEYTNLPDYIEAVYQLTTVRIQSDTEAVGKAAIEFWTTVAELEMEMEPEDPENRKYVETCMHMLIPVLLEQLSKQEEDADDEPWNLAAAAAVCIQNIANTVGAKIVQHVLHNYIAPNIQNQNWRLREAATLCFGQIMECADTDEPIPGLAESTMKTIIEQAMQLLISGLVDPHILVKDTSAWTIMQVATYHPTAIQPQLLNPLFTNLMASLDAEPRVAEKSASCVYALADSIEDIAESFPPEQGVNWIQPYFEAVLQKLFQVAARDDASESNLRITVYESINMMIDHHPPDLRAVIKQALPEVLQRLTATFDMQVMSQSDREEQAIIQGLQVATTHMIIRRVDAADVMENIGDKLIADAIMELLLRVLMANHNTATEEAFMAVGALSDKMEVNFERYLPHFMPLLMQGMARSEEYQICSSAVGVVGDLYRNMGTGDPMGHKMLPYGDELVQSLLAILGNPTLNRSVKPGVLSVIGDIAFSLGGHFGKYLDTVMAMLIQASMTVVPEDDEELVEYLGQLREGVLDAYVGIINGLEDAGPQALQHLIEPQNYAMSIAEFVKRITTDAVNMPDSTPAEVLKGAVGLVGDLSKQECLRMHVRQFFKNPQDPFVQQLLTKCREADPDSEDIVQFTWTQVQALP